MRATFGKWLKKVTKAFEAPKVRRITLSDLVQNNMHETDKRHALETAEWSKRPVVDRWEDPMKVSDFRSEGVGSITTIVKTEGDQIAETKADKEAWIHAYTAELDALQYLTLQNKIDAAFFAPMLKACMWAIEGQMSGVTETAVRRIQLLDMEHTGEIKFEELFLVNA